VADSDAETETATSDHPATDNALARRAHDKGEQPTFSEHAAFTGEATQSKKFMQENNRTLVRKEDKQATEYESTEDKSLNHAASLGDDHTVNFIDPNRAVVRKEKDNPELGNVDIMYSQNLVVRDANPQFSTGNATESGVINFKRFRKVSVHFVSFHYETYICDVYHIHGTDFVFIASACSVSPSPAPADNCILIFQYIPILLY